ncbi:helix-turn-helix domain-containing protein [Hymenobacter sp. HSC-4F20]|uniref:helix-turn-helix domain-containing protein n=1 Tax=Hymenobacter sp. HSC-4F20 TaxID=2864135 RepID=UPI001C7301F5|nr:helix-turn-helix domain-containing protein [Hymenobacter sp. HSC-4F20]MBX0289127.1 helix-turn-helix domain-containing protein [Hymenobacter sp. HSC-4F20]
MVNESISMLPRLRAWFGLSQAGLGRCLGLSKAMVSQVERGVRGLPLAASLPQAALTLAQQATPAAPAPELPNAATLREQQHTCQRRAEQLAVELSRMPERATWARRRLAALATLTAVLAPAGATPPAWLSSFEAEARAELERSGSTAQALLQARQAALAAEAAVLEQLLLAQTAAPESGKATAKGTRTKEAPGSNTPLGT